MLDWLLNLYQQFVVLSKGNPMIAGAISLWGLSVGTYLARNIPSRIWKFIASQCTTKLTIDNCSQKIIIDVAYHDFLFWYDQTYYAKWSRRLALKSSENKLKQKVYAAPGYGTHIFFWKGSLAWFRKQKLDSQGTYYQKEEITLTLLGRDQQKLKSIITAFAPKPDPDYLSVYKWNKNEWVEFQAIKPRSIKSVALSEQIRSNLLKTLEEFYKRRAWYDQKGLTHKIAILLHGISGTGKTSIIKALASEYKKSIYALNISMIDDSQLDDIFRKIPPDAFLVLEDIDSADAANTRHSRSKQSGKDNNLSSKETEIELSKFSALSLTGLLNILDGIVPLNDTVIFMTTNYLEKLDSALTRKGRTDLIFEIPALTRKEIVEYTTYMFNEHPDFDADTLQQTELIESITGSELQARLLEYKTDYSGFLTSITAQSENHIRFLEAI